VPRPMRPSRSKPVSMKPRTVCKEVFRRVHRRGKQPRERDGPREGRQRTQAPTPERAGVARRGGEGVAERAVRCIAGHDQGTACRRRSRARRCCCGEQNGGDPASFEASDDERCGGYAASQRALRRRPAHLRPIAMAMAIPAGAAGVRGGRPQQARAAKPVLTRPPGARCRTGEQQNHSEVRSPRQAKVRATAGNTGHCNTETHYSRPDRTERPEWFAARELAAADTGYAQRSGAGLAANVAAARADQHLFRVHAQQPEARARSACQPPLRRCAACAISAEARRAEPRIHALSLFTGARRRLFLVPDSGTGV